MTDKRKKVITCVCPFGTDPQTEVIDLPSIEFGNAELNPGSKIRFYYGKKISVNYFIGVIENITQYRDTQYADGPGSASWIEIQVRRMDKYYTIRPDNIIEEVFELDYSDADFENIAAEDVELSGIDELDKPLTTSDLDRFEKEHIKSIEDFDSTIEELKKMSQTIEDSINVDDDAAGMKNDKSVTYVGGLSHRRKLLNALKKITEGLLSRKADKLLNTVDTPSTDPDLEEVEKN